MKSVVRLAVLHDPMLLLSALGILVGRPPATISARAAQIFAAERTAEAVEDAILALNPGDPAIGGLATELVATGPGIPQPALSAEIEGDWLLLFTSKSDFDPRSPLGRRTDGSAPGLEGAFEQLTGGAVQASASPIQRAVTTAFKVVQTISLRGSKPPKVVQAVTLGGPFKSLSLSASASTSEERPARIDFEFDEGYFETEWGRLPYPVPFKFLPAGEAAAWIDTAYLSPRLRVSDGNKGTRFVLKRVGS